MDPTSPELDDAAPAWGPPQFRLRTLMLIIGALSALFAVMSALGGLWSMMLLLFLALVAAHVFGNALGTRLRDEATGRAAQPHIHWSPSGRAGLSIAPAQRLQERTGLTRTMLVMAAAGAIAGAMLGALALFCCDWQQMGLAGLGLGIFSSAVLGGFFGFLASSFLSIFRRALKEALAEDR